MGICDILRILCVHEVLMLSFNLALVKWAGRAIDVMQILLVSMHNYILITHLHTNELEKCYVIRITLYD
jgi:hypothetical protein